MTNTLRYSKIITRFFCLLVVFIVFLLSLTCFTNPALGADSITTQDFHASLLSALNKKLDTPLKLPLPADDEAFQITSLDLSNQSIQNLKGIEYFTNLTRLTLDYNKLTNLSNTKFPEKIRFLSLAHNSLSKVDDIQWPNQLYDLDLRNNRLTSPLGISLPRSVSYLKLDNNFLTNKIYSASYREITYDGNFIYEARSIQPANLLIKDLTKLTLYPGGQIAIPFVDIRSSTNPNNSIPANLLSASLAKGSQVAWLERQEYRFLIQARNAGNDTLNLRLDLTDYMTNQYESMNQSFYQIQIPITVWQSATDRNLSNVKNNGDTAIISALDGYSNHAVVDTTRFSKDQVSFSPGLLSELANKNKKLILTNDFGSLTLESALLKSLAKQASISSKSSIILTLSNYEQRPAGYGPSRFSDKTVSSLPYKDFNFSAQLQIPKQNLKQLKITSPVTVTLFLKNQNFTSWDFNHLTAFKDETNNLFLLGGNYNSSNGYFTYQINSTGRYGLGTRGKAVQWMDLAINSSSLNLSNGETIKLSPTPLLYQGVTMVPARAIFESMGANVRWNETNKMTVISYGNQSFYLKENTPITGSDQKPYILNGRMLVPLRYLSSEIGSSVLWWEDGGKIRIVY